MFKEPRGRLRFLARKGDSPATRSMQMRAPTVTRSWPCRLMGARAISPPPSFRLHLRCSSLCFCSFSFFFYSAHICVLFPIAPERTGQSKTMAEARVHFMHMRGALLLFLQSLVFQNVSRVDVSHCIKSSSFL